MTAQGMSPASAISDPLHQDSPQELSSATKRNIAKEGDPNLGFILFIRSLSAFRSRPTSGKVRVGRRLPILGQTWGSVPTLLKLNDDQKDQTPP